MEALQSAVGEEKEKVLYDTLSSIHDIVGSDSFNATVALVKFRKTPSKPRFPSGVKVAEVAPVPEPEVEEFKSQHVDSTYLKWGSEEAEGRTGKGVQQVRDLQYKRWKWCIDNLEKYVNTLRVCGHSDDAIQAMLDGRPLCLADAAMHTELTESLKALKPALEEEMGWTHVGYVFTGSSVAGFSQNPLKGREFEPTKITSTGKSDVDICIKGNGVDAFMEKLRKDGQKVYGFPTTCSPNTGGVRYGLPGDMGELVCKSLGEWYNTWNEKLPGGLQITFCEDALDIPAWEARIDVVS